VPQGRGKSRKRVRADVAGGRGASPEEVINWRRAFRRPIDGNLVKGVTHSLDEFRQASRAITAPADPFLAADAVTRSTLQNYKLEPEAQAAFDEAAPHYLFRGDDALCHRTPDGYKPTGLGALNFACIAETRAFWRRAFDCQLPTLPDLPAEG